eukprot:CAMPEP_0116010342 /NCGR_PEP_ID=MMETSP0321-20121206/3947_1 /TAXON_ID=163516 /ORGANISM="Leptocylindrus danicus var. danicus, Strain B650" /LENGTH=92 /DNA_ID=CAMNT_0003479429 /DNA_START=101 /DNA_END=376 /DNA_ORIENTATION=+
MTVKAPTSSDESVPATDTVNVGDIEMQPSFTGVMDQQQRGVTANALQSDYNPAAQQNGLLQYMMMSINDADNNKSDLKLDERTWCQKKWYLW